MRQFAPLINVLLLPFVASAQNDDSVPFPHPSITEVLYHVPNDAAADPSQDGKRSAVGDEFIEIANLHDKPINLQGYSVSDRGEQIKFTFPDFTLAPGEVVLLFNGHETTIAGATGTASEPPRERNAQFHGAWVFNLRNDTRNKALSNESDRVVLARPDGLPVDIVSWGVSDLRDYVSKPRFGFGRSSPGCSLQRVGGDGPLTPHKEIDGELFSPGWIPEKANAQEN